MFCVRCGKEIEENTAFCSYCGASLSSEAPAPTEENGVATLFHSILGKNQFRLAAIFYLISVCASVLATIIGGEFPVLNIVMYVFILISLFKLNNLAVSSAPLIAFASPLKTLRIIVKIYRIVLWVVVGIFAVCGLLIAFVGAIAGVGIGEIIEEALNEANLSLYDGVISSLGGIALVFMGTIFIVLAIIVALLNVFSFGSYYKTVSSAELTAGTGTYKIEALGATRGWLIFTVVCQCISALSIFIDIGPTTLLGLVSTGFNIAFTCLLINCIDEIKNSRQFEIL